MKSTKSDDWAEAAIAEITFQLTLLTTLRDVLKHRLQREHRHGPRRKGNGSIDAAVADPARRDVEDTDDGL